MHELEGRLPIGVGVHLVSDQPKIVEEAVGGFTEALVEAIGIVLFVSFVSLGVRAGLVVSISIPLVLAATFVVLEAQGVTLQRISLGALIIALGLLGRRRDDHRGVDGVAARGRRHAPRRGDLRLHVHRLPDADRHPRHGLWLPADRLQRQRGGRIYLQPVRRHRGGAARLMGRRGAVRPADRRAHPAGEA